MVRGKNRIPYWIDRRLTGLAEPEYDATISFGLPFESEDSQYGKYRLKQAATVQGKGDRHDQAGHRRTASASRQASSCASLRRYSRWPTVSPAHPRDTTATTIVSGTSSARSFAPIRPGRRRR